MLTYCHNLSFISYLGLTLYVVNSFFFVVKQPDHSTSVFAVVNVFKAIHFPLNTALATLHKFCHDNFVNPFQLFHQFIIICPFSQGLFNIMILVSKTAPVF